MFAPGFPVYLTKKIFPAPAEKKGCLLAILPNPFPKHFVFHAASESGKTTKPLFTQILWTMIAAQCDFPACELGGAVRCATKLTLKFPRPRRWEGKFACHSSKSPLETLCFPCSLRKRENNKTVIHSNLLGDDYRSVGFSRQ